MGDEKRTRRQFTSEDKAEAVKRHVVGGEAVSSVCEDLGIAPNLFYRWQKDLFDHAAAAFEVKGRSLGMDSRTRKLEASRCIPLTSMAGKSHPPAVLREQLPARFPVATCEVLVCLPDAAGKPGLRTLFILAGKGATMCRFDKRPNVGGRRLHRRMGRAPEMGS